MCNYIIQNLIFILFLGIYFLFFLKKRMDYWLFIFKIRKDKNYKPKNIFDSTLDTLGWQFFIFSNIFTIVYFFNKEGVLTDIFKIFGIIICNKN